MGVVSGHLQERMRLLSREDLELIVDNRRAEYTSDAVEAARHELASRPAIEAFVSEAGDSSGTSRKYQPLLSILPAGLWRIFCVATCVSVIAGLAVLFVGAIALAGKIPFAEVAKPLFAYAAVAAFALWIAAAIRAEHTYVRTLLLVLIAAGIVYSLVHAIVRWQVAQQDIIDLCVLSVAFWYFAFSETVTRYYRDRRAASS